MVAISFVCFDFQRNHLFISTIGSTDEADNEHQTEWGKEQLQAMSYRLNTLETLVKEQNTQIQKLQHDLKDTVSLHEIFSKELDSAMSTNRVHLAKLFDNYMNVQQSREREFQESLLNGITGVVTKQLVEKLQAVIISEIKHCVLPAVLGVFENLKHQLDIQYSQKLNSTDHLLRDNIAKLVTSKVINCKCRYANRILILILFYFSLLLILLVHLLLM